MASDNSVLKALFLEIFYEGIVVLDKRKLLSLIDKAHDRPTAWERLLALWEDHGYDRNELVGTWYDRNIVLAYGKKQSFEPVTKWAAS